MRAALAALAVAVALALVPAAPVVAHDLEFLDALVVLKRDGTFVADLTVDVDALALGVPPEGDDALEVAQRLTAMSPAEYAASVERARDTLQRRVRFRFDGEPAPFEVAFPDEGSPRLERLLAPSVLGLTARFTGNIPDDAETFVFFASRAFGPAYLTIVDQRTADGVQYPLEPGQRSEPYPLRGRAADRAGDGSGGGDRAAGMPSRLDVAGRYLKLGFTHILPKGLDHILFVLGLFLLSARLAPLLWQVSAFTVAHTATLALSIYGVVELPSRLVESLIALSIAYVAVENVVLKEMRPWRPALVFAFGLLHGLGFAGVLRELGLPRDRFVEALISFNVGVELGQIAVILLALAAVGWARDRDWFRPRIAIPASLAIAAVGLFWTVERAFLGG